MSSQPRPHRRRIAAVVAAGAAAVLTLSACASTAGGSGQGGASAGTGGSITLGTTDKVTVLDPAGSYDNGSSMVMTQVFPNLFSTKPGGNTAELDIATSAEFTAPTTFTVKLKPGLTFTNGHALTSSDVKFTFDRQLKINDPNGPASLLGNLASVAAPDDTTVEFTLKQANDQTFAQVLSSPAGPIVDEEVFPADSILGNDEIAASGAFAGPYSISSFRFNELIQFTRNDAYQGALGAPKNQTAQIKYYANAANLKLEVQNGTIDVAWRSLAATDIESLRGDDKVKVLSGPGGEIRYIVFNIDTQPFGAKAEGADPAKARAVRQAVAHLIDRDALSAQVYKGTYTPLFSFVPEGLPGAATPLKSLYGDGAGKPSLDKARAVLQQAGVAGPVALNLQYSPDHYGPSSGDEYGLIKQQLEASGLFTVNLQSTEWTQYSKQRVADAYPAYQLGWFPDYSDADTYLTPFFSANTFLANHYSNTEVQDLLARQLTTADPAERQQVIEQIQQVVAGDLPTVPYLQGTQTAIAGAGVQGVQDTLDASFKFRLGVVSK